MFYGDAMCLNVYVKEMPVVDQSEKYTKTIMESMETQKTHPLTMSSRRTILPSTVGVWQCTSSWS